MALARLTTAQIAEVLGVRGYELLSAEGYTNRKSYVVVRCPKCSGELKAIFGNLAERKQRVCGDCNEKARLDNIRSRLDAIAREFGLTTDDDISKITCMTRTKVNFTCREGHKSRKAISGVRHVRGGCRRCYTNSKRYSTKFIEEETKRLRPDIEIINPGEWVAISQPRQVKCLIHDRVFSCSVHNLWYSNTTCPECREFGFDVDSEAFLYYSKIWDFYKIGVTNYHPAKRLLSVHKDAELIDYIKFDTGQKALDAETMVLDNFRHANIGYNPGVKSGWTEMFKFDIFAGTKLFTFRGYHGA